MAPQTFDEIGAADDDARLRATEELVAREADEVGTRAKALRRRRLVADAPERAGAEVVDERQAGSLRDRGELAQLGPLCEPEHAEVRLVHAQQQGRLRPDRTLVVGGARPIRRADLDEARARADEDVGDAEAVADLDELASRHDHLAALRERREREEDGGRVVVDDERGLRTRQTLQQLGEVILTRPTLASLEVVLEVRVAGAHLGHARERGLREGCATEVRVHENAGRVQHAPQRRLPRARELREDRRRRSSPGRLPP